MKPKILVIEDDIGHGQSLKFLLERKGAETQVARDGAQGLVQARSYLPDLILLDVLLPKINGFELCKALKADPATQNIPVVMMTGMDKMGDVEQGFEAGANGYLIKPVEPERLFKKISEFLPAFGQPQA